MNDVVKLEIVDNHIAIITMQDSNAKNCFSMDLITGLNNFFEQVHNNDAVKVILLKGLDSYFCCGGTKEMLMELAQGKGTFADYPFYRLLLDCEIPVIAAMKGHALGGGFAFSTFADIMIMAEESTYASNFMKYGFTPGFGATFIMPYKFGTVLGAELLYTAQEYEGRDLKARNVPIRIVPRAQVDSVAMNIAKDLIQKPKVSLKLLKQHLIQKIKNDLPKAVEQELAMHKVSFNLPVVKENIEKLF